MEKNEIIKNIAKRSGGEIYLGVVGAVRTGKSTLIKRMIETLIIPNIDDEYERKRALDEAPQSAAGKTIMTTEPKFVPNNSAKIQIDDVSCNIKLIDCVGYMINNAIGATDENGPRMVKTPWYTEEIPFTEAAEIGTEKVIKEHSTIGIVVTSDGSFGEFQRNDYIEAEKRVIEELNNAHTSTANNAAYNNIDGAWKTEKPYAVVHRMAFSSKARGGGLSQEAFRLIKDYRKTGKKTPSDAI